MKITITNGSHHMPTAKLTLLLWMGHKKEFLRPSRMYCMYSGMAKGVRSLIFIGPVSPVVWAQSTNNISVQAQSTSNISWSNISILYRKCWYKKKIKTLIQFHSTTKKVTRVIEDNVKGKVQKKALQKTHAAVSPKSNVMSNNCVQLIGEEYGNQKPDTPSRPTNKMTVQANFITCN